MEFEYQVDGIQPLPILVVRLCRPSVDVVTGVEDVRVDASAGIGEFRTEDVYKFFKHY